MDIETIEEIRENPVWSPILFKYKLDKFLGYGAYGQVVRAYCRRSKKLVAIKHIPDAYRS